MSEPPSGNVPGWLIPVITDALNLSIRALEEVGAIDTRKLRKHYKGIGSKYYDIVTKQIEEAIKLNAFRFQTGGTSDQARDLSD